MEHTGAINPNYPVEHLLSRGLFTTNVIHILHPSWNNNSSLLIILGHSAVRVLVRGKPWGSHQSVIGSVVYLQWSILGRTTTVPYIQQMGVAYGSYCGRPSRSHLSISWVCGLLATVHIGTDHQRPIYPVVGSVKHGLPDGGLIPLRVHPIYLLPSTFPWNRRTDLTHLWDTVIIIKKLYNANSHMVDWCTVQAI